MGVSARRHLAGTAQASVLGPRSPRRGQIDGTMNRGHLEPRGFPDRAYHSLAPAEHRLSRGWSRRRPGFPRYPMAHLLARAKQQCRVHTARRRWLSGIVASTCGISLPVSVFGVRHSTRPRSSPGARGTETLRLVHGGFATTGPIRSADDLLDLAARTARGSDPT